MKINSRLTASDDFKRWLLELEIGHNTLYLETSEAIELANNVIGWLNRMISTQPKIHSQFHTVNLDDDLTYRSVED